MKKNIIFTIVSAIMIIASPAGASILKGYVLVDGKQVPAEYTKLSDNTVSVGNGKNSCISTYTAGYLTVPAEVTISDITYQVTDISKVAFRLCNKITGVNIQEGIKHIGEFAFVGCQKLSEVIFPASLMSIGSGAFIETLSLQQSASVTCLGTTPPQWEYNDVFMFHSLGITDPNAAPVPPSVELFVPEGMEDTYMNANFTNPDLGWTGADGWGSFTSHYTGIKSLHVYRGLDLMALREIVNDEGQYNTIKEVYLENDIDMGGTKWDWGIGKDETCPFEGNFYGNGHTISNLKVYNTSGPAGLFSYFGGKNVENVCLKNFDVQGYEGAGAFAGASGQCSFTGVWAENCSYQVTNGHIGGILGKCLTGGGANLIQCIVKDIASIVIQQSTPGELMRSGGIIGFGYGGVVKDCAVIGSVHSPRVDPFVGACSPGNVFFIKSSYATDEIFGDYTPAENILFDDKVVICGNKTYDVKFPNGTTQSVTIDEAREFASLLMIPALGLDDWVYQDGYMPLPLLFEDKMPVNVNGAEYRPMSANTSRVNGLMLASGTPWTTFLDLSDTGYRSKRYSVNRLWVNGNNPYDKDAPVTSPYPSQYLPIGTATIYCRNGVEFDRTLDIVQSGTKEYTVPKIAVDAEGNPMLDDDGNYILDGEVAIYETPTYSPTGYCVYLPYTLHQNNTFELYKPDNVTVNGNVALLNVEEIDDETLYPWTPYYLVVTDASVSLSTDEQVTITPEPADSYIPFGPDSEYQMCGNISRKSPADNMLVLDHLDDFKRPSATLDAWNAFFNVPDGINELLVVRELRFYDNIDNSATIEEYNNSTVKATLKGHTFIKDGTWYTLCLPFDVSGDLGPLEGATICKLSGSSINDGTLSINFQQVNQIEAGMPYLVKWHPGESIYNPSFFGVTIKDEGCKDIKAGEICMVGRYMPTKIRPGEHTLYLGDNDKLYTPDRQITVNAFRATFFYNDTAQGQPFSAIKLNFIPADSGVDNIYAPQKPIDPNWYTIDGRTLNGKPTAPGIYINNGKKVIIR